MLCVAWCKLHVVCCKLYDACCTVQCCLLHVRTSRRREWMREARKQTGRGLRIARTSAASASRGRIPCFRPASGRCKARRRAGAKPGVGPVQSPAFAAICQKLFGLHPELAQARNMAHSLISARAAARPSVWAVVLPDGMPQYRCASGCIRRASAVPAAGSTARTRPSRQR